MRLCALRGEMPADTSFLIIHYSFFILQVSEHRPCIQAGTGFGSDAGQVSVAHQTGMWKELPQFQEKENQLFGLFGGAGVGGTAVRI